MTFVPLQGPASFHVAVPGRRSEVSLRAGRRTVRLPLAAAIPALTRAPRAHDVHPSVGLLGGATLLAVSLVAQRRTRPTPSGEGWQAQRRTSSDADRVAALVDACPDAGVDVDAATRLVQEVIDAVVDTMTAPPPRDATAATDPTLAGGAVAVRLVLRVEAPAEMLAAGELVVVPQVHDADEPTRFCDLEQLWIDPDAVGFAPEARLRAVVALREAAGVWPVLETLLRRTVPDRLVLSGEELGDLLGERVGALGELGVDVLWPRSLQAELTQRAEIDRRTGPADEPLVTGLFGPESLFGFRWRLALRTPAGDDPLTDAEMRGLAEAASPIVRLRDNWTVVDPAVLRRARRWASDEPRPLKPAAALRATLTGALDVDGESVDVHPGASLLKVREQVRDAASLSPLPAPPGLRGELRDYQRRGVTWLAELTGMGLGVVWPTTWDSARRSP